MHTIRFSKGLFGWTQTPTTWVRTPAGWVPEAVYEEKRLRRAARLRVRLLARLEARAETPHEAVLRARYRAVRGILIEAFGD